MVSWFLSRKVQTETTKSSQTLLFLSPKHQQENKVMFHNLKECSGHLCDGSRITGTPFTDRASFYFVFRTTRTDSHLRVIHSLIMVFEAFPCLCWLCYWLAQYTIPSLTWNWSLNFGFLLVCLDSFKPVLSVIQALKSF